MARLLFFSVMLTCMYDDVSDYDRQEADGEHLRTCSFEQPIDPKENKACRFALESIASNCSIAQQFGYEYGQPCVLLKLNRVCNLSSFAFDLNL